MQESPGVLPVFVQIPLNLVAKFSGPGGQNVNKVPTKIEMRFELNSASWLSEVRPEICCFFENLSAE